MDDFIQIWPKCIKETPTEQKNSVRLAWLGFCLCGYFSVSDIGGKVLEILCDSAA